MITISDENSIFLLLPAFSTSCCTDQIVDEVGEGPDHGHAGEGDAEQDDVQQADAQDVGQPHPSAVHHSCVGVHLAVCRTHVHGAQGRLQYPPRQPGLLKATSEQTSDGMFTVCRTLHVYFLPSNYLYLI